MDVGVKNVNNVAPGVATTSTAAGNNNRIAFGVSEDLGGGLKAIANAQMRFDPNTGLTEAAGARPLFQGETRVGLAGGFGTLLMGRGLTALQLANGGQADPFGVSTVAGSVYAAGFASDYAAGGEGRIDGAVFYTLPTFNGLTISTSYSPKKLVSATSAITSTQTHQSLNAVYATGALTIGAGSEQNRVGDKLTQLYGTYNFGKAKLHASTATIKGGTTADRTNVTFSAAASAVNTGGTTSQVAAGGEIKNWTLGLTVPLSGVTTLRTGYSGWNGNGAAGQQDDTKFGLGVKYDLSKRTYVYSDIASQSRKNNTATASPATSNSKVRSFDLGVSHSF